MRRKLSALVSDTKIRFLVVGGWNTAFGYAVFRLLYVATSRIFATPYFAYTSAQIAGWVIAVANAYVLHKYVTFRSAARGRAAWAEFFRFMQTYVGMFLFGLVLLPFLVEVMGFGPPVAALIATAIGVVISYVGHRFNTFRRGDTADS